MLHWRTELWTSHCSFCSRLFEVCVFCVRCETQLKERLGFGNFMPVIGFSHFLFRCCHSWNKERLVLHLPRSGLCRFCEELGRSRVTDDFVTCLFCTPPYSLDSNSPSFLSAFVYLGACQQVKRRKDAGENRIRPGGKRVKIRHPKIKDGGGKGQSLLTQVLDKGRFVRLGQSTTVTPGKNIELRCKGNSIGWSYPTNLDTFNDSRLRCLEAHISSDAVRWCECVKVLHVCFPPAASNTVTSTVSWSWCRPLLPTQVPTAAGW